MLRDEALIYTQELRKAGVDVDTKIYPGLPHVFWDAFPSFEATAKAKADMVEGVRAFFKGKKE